MNARVLPIPIFVSVEDVSRTLGVSLKTAYRHLRLASRREPGHRGLLRVEASVWAAYVKEHWQCDRIELRVCSPSAPKCTGVYFVQHDADGPIKIGFAANIALRMRLLQAGNPCPLYLRGFIRTDTPSVLERELHLRFSIYRRSGEWFQASSPILAFIASETEKHQ